MDITKLDQIPEKHLLVIGDIMLDKYVEGKVQRMSPEAPVPILTPTHGYSKLGGAANVARNVIGLGAKCTVLGLVGNDHIGREIVTKLEKSAIPAYVCVEEGRKSTLKQRFIAEEGHLMRLDIEDTQELTKESVIQIISDIERASLDISGIIISDYDKGAISKDIIDYILSVKASKSIPVYVDPKHRHFRLYKGVDIFKPNKKELAQACSNEGSFEEQFRKVVQTLGCDHLFCTLAGDGIAYMDAESIKIENTTVSNAIDVSGAGDTVMAVMALGHQCGYSPKDLCYLGNIAGGIACGERGVVAITSLELLNALL